MKRITLYVLIPILSAVLAGPTFAAAPPAIEGRWVSHCLALPKRHSIGSSVRVDRARLQIKTKLFADARCATHTVTLTYLARYRVGKAAGEGFELDLRSQGIRVVLHRPEVVAHYNRKKACGIKDWALNQAREVSARSCDSSSVPKLAGNSRDIYQVENGILYFGTTPFSRADARPAALNRNLAFRRKENAAIAKRAVAKATKLSRAHPSGKAGSGNAYRVPARSF